MPQICCICETNIESSTGNNPEPFFPRDASRNACNLCNDAVVTPARVARDVTEENWEEKLREYRLVAGIRVD